MYRQGEVLIVPMQKGEKIKGSLKANKVIAEGEAMGHLHELEQGELYESEGQMFLKADKPSVLKHPEHGQMTIPKGRYEIIIQQEYEEGGVRNVVD
jgi:hypothetical protein